MHVRCMFKSTASFVCSYISVQVLNFNNTQVKWKYAKIILKININVQFLKYCPLLVNMQILVQYKAFTVQAQKFIGCKAFISPK